ncbi:MAG: PHP domain-containing protein, partial [Peptococcaceae bacterium]|nr:PHP domain-containing protein [Peptococcaceae bacterium]
MPVDYHLHSQFSGDSKTTLDAICSTAIARGLKEIAITDHMDYSYPDIHPDHQIADIDHYINTIAQYQQKYAGQLTIRTGIEIGME